MNDHASDSPHLPQTHNGYVSEESKKKFTITVGILGAVFFFLQILIPFIAMLVFLPFFFSSVFSFETYDFSGAAVYDNHFYFFARNTGPAGDKVPRELVRLDLSSIPMKERPQSGWRRFFGLSRGEPAEIEKVIEVAGENPRVLADAEGLLVISRSQTWRLDDGKLVPILTYPPLGDISRPFLYHGMPAVLEGRPGGISLAVLESGQWKRTPIALEQEADFREVEGTLAVVTVNDTQHVFWKVGEVIFHRTGLPLEATEQSGNEWESVASVKCRWQSTVLDSKPALFVRENDYLQGFVLEKDQWRRFLDAPLNMPLNSFFILPSPDGAVRIAVQSFPLSLEIYSIEGNKLVANLRIGNDFPFPPAFFVFILIANMISFLVPLILVVVISGLMQTYRVTTYSFAGRAAPYASLVRRALAQAVDGLIMLAGGLPLFVQSFRLFDFDETATMTNPGIFMVRFMMLLLLFFVWPLVLLIVFSVTEGRWGITPGKWLVGIKVTGMDLKPCGFWRALLRNVLKVVDSFFNFMVGILIISFTKDWQRVGDLAARTIVVRKSAEI